MDTSNDEILSGCALALDLVLDCSFIACRGIDTSSYHVVFINKALSTRLFHGTNTVSNTQDQVITKDISLLKIALHTNDATSLSDSSERKGSLSLGYKGGQFEFAFRSSSSKDSLLEVDQHHILKEFNELGCESKFIQICGALIDILEGEVKTEGEKRYELLQTITSKFLPLHKDNMCTCAHSCMEQAHCKPILCESLRKNIKNERTFDYLSEFFNTAPIGISIIDVDGDGDITSVVANNIFSNIHGLHPDQLRDKRYQRDLDTSQQEIDEIINACQASRLSSQPQEFMYKRFDRVSNNYKTYDTIVTCMTHNRYSVVVRDEAKSEASTSTTTEDLSTLIHSKTEELRISEDKFQALVTNAPNIIITINCEGVIQFANRLIDNKVKLVERKVCEIFSGLTLDHITLAFISDSVIHCEGQCNTKWYNMSVKTITHNLALIVATDVTESKLLQDKLHKAMQAKSRFLANMSHEVRTPLSGIIGMSQALEDSKLTSDQAECVDTIKQCSDILLTVINDILDYSKIDSVGLALCESEISLMKCLEDAMYMVAPAAQAKGLDIVLNVDMNIPQKVFGDVVRIRQILLNLLNNAVKFTDKGHVLMTAGGKRVEGDKWEFNFCIKDTGCGIPRDYIDKLFEIFYQIDGSTTRKYGGTGIGLAYARKLIESMAGKVKVESSGVPGEGSAFYFSIILQVAPGMKPFSPPLSSSLSSLSSSHDNQTTPIMLVGKPVLSRDILQKQLSNLGFQVFLFSAWHEADAKLRFFQKDKLIIFVDIDLFITEVNRYQQRENIAVVLTGPTPQLWMREKGYPLFLRKPIRATSLLVTLSHSLEKLEKYERTERDKFSKFEKFEKFEKIDRNEKPRLGPTHILRKGSIDVNMMGNRSLGYPTPSPLRRSSGIDHMIVDPRKRTNSSHNLMMPHIPQHINNNSDKNNIINNFHKNISNNNINNNSLNNSNLYLRRQSLLSSWENVRFEEEENEEQDSFYTGIDGLFILIVEEKQILDKFGITKIASAINGQEALKKIEGSLPDLVIMDIQMPIMDGVECTRRIRTRYGKNWPHIIALTADAFDEDEQKCREAGANEFLTKPTNPEKLKACLHRCAYQKLGMNKARSVG